MTDGVPAPDPDSSMPANDPVHTSFAGIAADLEIANSWRFQQYAQQLARSMQIAQLPPPPWLDDLRRLTQQFTAAQQLRLDTIVAPLSAKNFDTPIIRFDNAIADLMKATADLIPKVRTDWFAMPSLVSEELRRVAERLEQHRPRNWPRPGSEPGWSSITSFIQETAWPLVWVPRVEVIEQLVTSEDRDSAVVESSTLIIEDCDEVLREVLGTDIAAVSPYALDAVAAARAELWVPAQATAALVLDMLLQRHVGFGSLKEARDELRGLDPDEAPWDISRFILVLSCVPNALAQYFPGDPIPTEFNRHASVHGMSEEQYTQRNALVGLMMVTALIREIHDHQTKGTWSQFFDGNG